MVVARPSVESWAARLERLSTRMMPPGSSVAARPWPARMALNARSHGWSLISAVTVPLMSLPVMMERPEKAAKFATTSWMLARSKVTLILGCCDATRAEPAMTAFSTSEGVARGAGAGAAASAGAVARTGIATGSGAGALRAPSLDHAANSWAAAKATCTPELSWLT